MPPEIRRIAVPTDFSEASARAISYAAALARRMGASLYLIHVLKDQNQYHDARTRLATLANTLTGGVRRVAIEVRDGQPVDSIAQAAMHYGADLIVLATHGRTGLPHLFLGSVAEELIRTACCPVLVVRDSGTVQVHRPATSSSALANSRLSTWQPLMQSQSPNTRSRLRSGPPHA